MHSCLQSVVVSLMVIMPGLAGAAGENAGVDPAWLFVPEPVPDPVTEVVEPIPGSDLDLHLFYVETIDGLYAPVGLMKPAGDGPFPVVLIAHMNGALGTRWIREWSRYGNWTPEQFVEAGYAVAWMRYRAEVETPYEEELEEGRFQGRPIFNRGPFEYKDAIAIIEFVKKLPYIDDERTGYLGLSHGGEMLMKIASEYHGIRAGVAVEPASLEFLAMKPRQPGAPDIPETRMDITGETLARELEETRARADIDTAMQRIRRINTPIFIQGRRNDNNEAVFRLNYELLRDAGKDAKWKTYSHAEHGFIFVRRNRDGEYEPDPIQRQAVRDALDYLNEHLKP